MIVFAVLDDSLLRQSYFTVEDLPNLQTVVNMKLVQVFHTFRWFICVVNSHSPISSAEVH